jgi:hypothetical protein
VWARDVDNTIERVEPGMLYHSMNADREPPLDKAHSTLPPYPGNWAARSALIAHKLCAGAATDKCKFIWTELYQNDAALIFHFDNPEVVASLGEKADLFYDRSGYDANGGVQVRSTGFYFNPLSLFSASWPASRLTRHL